MLSSMISDGGGDDSEMLFVKCLPSCNIRLEKGEDGVINLKVGYNIWSYMITLQLVTFIWMLELVGSFTNP